MKEYIRNLPDIPEWAQLCLGNGLALLGGIAFIWFLVWIASNNDDDLLNQL
jgi:hypothetical protein